jgi:hypothetical protein
MASTQTAPIPAVPTPEEQAILAAYPKTETNGLEFGRLCYDYREKHSAQGSRTGGGLAQLLRKLGIKEGKAYYWIAAYEETIGVRQPAPDEDVIPEPATSQEPVSATVSGVPVFNPDNPPVMQQAKPRVIELKEGTLVRIGHTVCRDRRWELEPSVLGSDLTGWRAGEPLF